MERVGVLMGGCSSEREISLKSGRAVHQALAGAGWDAVPLDLQTTSEDEIVSWLQAQRIDVVFIALHGAFGEDGTVQAILERAGIAYTGSGPQASRLAMHKGWTQDRLKACGIPVPEYRLLSRTDALDAPKMMAELGGGPVVVKPAGQGSSIGVHIVERAEALENVFQDALRYGDEVLVDRFVPGREVTAGVLNGEALPLVEIRSRQTFFDFEAKYQAGATEYLVPAPLSADITARIQELAVRACEALGCRDMARADVRIDPQGGLFFLEVNTIPGFTSTSLLPKAAKAAGYSFEDLCGKIVRAALDRRGAAARPA